MRKRLLASCVLALAGITAMPLSASDEKKSPDDLVLFPSRPFLENGLKRESVVRMLGRPSAQLSPDVWVYFDYRSVTTREAKVHIERPPTLDTAIVMFENDRIREIRLCDSKPVRAFLAKQERKAPVEPVLAAQHAPAGRSSPGALTR